MIRVSINGHERDYDDVTSSWLNEQIEERRKNRATVCVRVTIHHGGLNLILSTPACPCSNDGSRRRPSHHEQELFDLWAMRGMDDDAFNVGQLTAFLNQLKSRL